MAMTLWSVAVLAAVMLAALGYVRWSDLRGDYLAEARLEDGPPAVRPQIFSPDMLDGLPDNVRRYFLASIAPGTLLRTRVALSMTGTFSLGTREAPKVWSMTAREVLAAPSQFIWRPQLRAGPFSMAGSDGLLDGRAWTRFWLAPLLPVARVKDSPDQRRAAATRALLESIWAPAGLLPQAGAQWRAIDAQHAEVSITRGGEQVTAVFAFSDEGFPAAVSAQRWTDANPDRVFRWQPFGARLANWRDVEGFAIPTDVVVSNQFGGTEEFPFFSAHVEEAHFF